MAQFRNIFPVNLENGPEKVALRPMHYGDKLANRVGALVYEGQSPVSLGGYCNATVILSDGSTIAVPNGNVSGNQAYVDLPAGVYSVPGPIQIYLHWYSNGTITTLLAAFGNVVLTETDTVIDPGTVIPGVASLMDMYMSATAPEFAATDAYEKGDYVWYEGVLYRFTANHAAGAWNSSQATAAVIGEDLAELARSNLDYQTLTGKPTANLAPGFGESITISQVKRDSHGNIESLTDRTITMPSSVASTSAAGLMSANDKTKLNNMTPLYYGECTTAAATQEKTVTISGITELYNGLTIFVRFVNAQTYNGIPKLNVNNLGALYIYRSGATAAGATEWQAETVLALTRYENVWFIVDGDRATTGRYGKTILSGNTTSSSTASAVNSAGLREFIENVISNAPIYSDSSAYAEGDYVRKGNKIYRCTDAKAAGAAWSNMDWVGMPQIYDVIDSLYTRKIQYSGTCSTEAATQTKVVTGIGANYRDIDGLYFKDGVVVYVKFDYAQGYNGTPMLSVNGTVGNIYYNDVQPAGLNAWNGGQTLAFRLKRTTGIMRWYIVGTTYDPATTSVNGLMSYSDKKKLDELEVGGRNLLLNSAKPDVYSDDLTLAVTRNVAVPEWGATDATRITGSGGAYNYVCYVGGKAENIAYGKYIGESGKNYTISIYIKNNHSTNKCGVRINLPYDPGYTMIDPGATMKVEQTATGNGNVRLAIFFSTENVGEAFDFTIWHPMIETGTIPTDWTPALEDNPSNDTGDVNISSYLITNLLGTLKYRRIGKMVMLELITNYIPRPTSDTIPSGTYTIIANHIPDAACPYKDVEFPMSPEGSKLGKILIRGYGNVEVYPISGSLAMGDRINGVFTYFTD